MSSPETEGQDVQQEEGEDRPEWLLPRFKNESEQARSFAEAEKEMNRLRSELDNERQQFISALEQYETVNQQQRQPDPNYDPQTNQLIQQYQNAVDTQDAGAQLAINLALNKQLLDQALEERFKELGPNLDAQTQAQRDIAFQIAQDTVRQSYGDKWESLAEPVQAWLREHQSWLPAVNDPKAFETVIREAARTVENDKAAEQLRALEADRAAKLSAATSTGSGQGKFPTATDDKKQQWEEIKNADVVSYGELRRG